MIAERLAAHLRAQPERGDEHLPHISDLYGCDRATWARRNGKTLAKPSDELRLKWAMGKDVERLVAKSLGLESSGDIILRIGEMIGHADHDDGEEVLEVKSTWFKGGVPKKPDEHYEIQALGYAVGLGRKRARIFIVCRASGRKAEFELDVTPERETWIRNRAAEVIAVTRPGAPEPKCTARYPWQKRQCEATDCGMKK